MGDSNHRWVPRWKKRENNCSAHCHWEKTRLSWKELLLNAGTKRGLLASWKSIPLAPKPGTYLSSFMAISKGSVSPSNSTITGAHILGQNIDNHLSECTEKRDSKAQQPVKGHHLGKSDLFLHTSRRKFPHVVRGAFMCECLSCPIPTGDSTVGQIHHANHSLLYLNKRKIMALKLIQRKRVETLWKLHVPCNSSTSLPFSFAHTFQALFGGCERVWICF